MRTDAPRLKRLPPVPAGLKALLGSIAQAKLLVQFFLRPGEAFHVRELTAEQFILQIERVLPRK